MEGGLRLLVAGVLADDLEDVLARLEVGSDALAALVLGQVEARLAGSEEVCVLVLDEDLQHVELRVIVELEEYLFPCAFRNREVFLRQHGAVRIDTLTVELKRWVSVDNVLLRNEVVLSLWSDVIRGGSLTRTFDL